MANIIYQCSKEELRCELWDIFKQMKAEAQRQAEVKASEVLLTSEEVLETLKISSATLWRWSKTAYLTPIFIGGQKRYRRSDVKAIIERGASYGN